MQVYCPFAYLYSLSHIFVIGDINVFVSFTIIESCIRIRWLY